MSGYHNYVRPRKKMKYKNLKNLNDTNLESKKLDATNLEFEIFISVKFRLYKI